MNAYEIGLMEFCIKQFPKITGLEKCDKGGQKIVFNKRIQNIN